MAPFAHPSVKNTPTENSPIQSISNGSGIGPSRTGSAGTPPNDDASIGGSDDDVDNDFREEGVTNDAFDVDSNDSLHPPDDGDEDRWPPGHWSRGTAAEAEALLLELSPLRTSRSGLAEHNILSRSNSSSSVNNGPGQQYLQNSAQSSSAFKDPFPSLSPMPSTSSLQSGNIPRMQKRNVHVEFQSSSITETVPIKSIAYSSPTKRSSGSHTPPSTQFATFQTPPTSRSSTPQPLLVQKTPTKSSSNNSQKLWIDPFPTPDASVCSRHDTSTPFSSRANADLDDWDTILRTVPKIPLIEGLSMNEERERKTFIVNKSCPLLQSMEIENPRLQSMGVENMPVRHVASESNLPLMKRPSMEDIWGALKAGPDGNDLEAEYKKESKGKKKKMEKDHGKRIDSNNSLKDFELPLQPRRKDHTFERSSISPMKTSREGLRKRPTKTTDKIIKNNLAMNSSTITNSTGADLAEEVKMIMLKRESPNGPLTPSRLSLRELRATSSRALANTKESVGELMFSPVKTVHKAYQTNSQRAAKLVRNTRQKLKERKELRRQRRLARIKEAPRSWWIVIPADHPYKIAWDIMTMLWALLGAYRTHVRIRDRVFDQSPLIILTEVWFTVDILLNFVTEHKTRKGEVIRDGKAVWARYLTTWFIIDILSLIPWERIYVRPVVERIKKRNIFQKTFFRSKAVVRVSRVLRGRHIKLFGRVSKQTGTPLRRLVTLVIKYLPKYLVFLRNMKGALVVRALRFVHWLHNMYKKIWVKAKNARRNLAARRRLGHPLFSPVRSSDDDSDSDDDDDDDDDSSDHDSDSDSVSDDSYDDHVDVDGQDNDDDENIGRLVRLADSLDRELTSFHRAYSDGSPVVAQRRRSFSQSEVLNRNLGE